MFISVVVAILVVVFLIWSIVALNEYCEKTFNYEPFNIGISALLMIPLGCAFYYSDAKYGTSISKMTPEFIQNMNYVLYLGIAVLGSVFIWTSYKTTILVGLYSTILQCAIALLFIIVTVILIIALSDINKHKSNYN